MSQPVSVPKSLIYALCVLLAACLIVISFLVGRQSGAGAPRNEATPTANPPLEGRVWSQAQPAPKSLEERVDAIDKRVQAVQQGGTERLTVSSTSLPSAPREMPDSTPLLDAPLVSHPTPLADGSKERDYLREVDAVVGSTALAGTQPLGVKLVERAMASGLKERAALIDQTEQARVELETIAPPDSCREHHALLLKELGQASELLREATKTAESGDTERVSELTESDTKAQADSHRLRELDRALRSRGL